MSKPGTEFRVVLLADGAVGTALTRWMLEHHLSDVVLVVVTDIDNAVADVAREAGVDVVAGASNDALVDHLQQLGPIDLGFLLWWPKIVPESILVSTRQGFINTHPSLLPHNRGKHYNFWALVEQSPFGVSLHWVDRGIDSGDIVCQRPIETTWEDTGGTLYDKAQHAMVELFCDSYTRIRSGEVSRTQQDLEAGSLHLSKELHPASRIALDETTTPRELLNLLRARTFPGHPACWFQDQGETYEVRIRIERKPI